MIRLPLIGFLAIINDELESFDKNKRIPSLKMRMLGSIWLYKTNKIVRVRVAAIVNRLEYIQQTFKKMLFGWFRFY